MAHPTVIAKELNILNRYCKQLRILEDYLTQYEEGNFSPRILMAGKTSNEKIDQLGRTMDIDVKAYIRELFENEWIKEYGSEQNLLENAPDVLKIKGDLSELIVAIQHKRKMYYDWKDKVLFIAEKKGNLRLMPMHFNIFIYSDITRRLIKSWDGKIKLTDYHCINRFTTV